LARSARRIGAWTTNLLATGLVLVVGLTFGRQLASWWALRSEGSSQRALGGTRFLDQAALEHEAAAPLLDFGDLPMRLGRETVTGDKQRVFASLRARCRAGAQQNLASARVPGPREQRMLRGTVDLTPVDQEPGKWKMYQLDGPLPMVVVTATRNDVSGRPGDQPPARALVWGLAFPVDSGTDQWTLFTCVPTEGLGPAASDPLALPIPPAGRRLMSLRATDGGGMVLLAGTDESQDWCRVLDAGFEQQGWSARGGWQAVGAGWHRRYAHRGQGFVVDVLLERGSEWRVLMTVARQ
jgi:hypothetical protein